MKQVEIKINNGQDRSAVVVALAFAGYKVSVREEKFAHKSGVNNYFVVFELTEAWVTNLK